MPTIFFTGFPGFLGSQLLPRVLSRSSDTRAVCLIQKKFSDLAHRRVGELHAAHPKLAGRIELIAGDITRADLDLDARTTVRLHGDTAEIYHLAAVYDLSVRPDVAQRVNVDGSRHMLDFAAACPGLERFQYVSTCYVSGRHPGVFTESDLEVGQTFNNFYESTKHAAEVEVQQRMEAGLPTTIYRPAITVGDSATGATQKFDGPYYFIRWVVRQPHLALMPVVGNPEKTRVNVVPSDFVVDSIAHLSALPASRGKVYQLADPDPMTVDEILSAVARASGRKLLRLKLPLAVAKGAIEYVPFVERILQIPASAVDYFVHPTHYTSENTQADLAGSGISCPPLATYLPRLVEFVEAHPDVESAAMV